MPRGSPKLGVGTSDLYIDHHRSSWFSTSTGSNAAANEARAMDSAPAACEPVLFSSRMSTASAQAAQPKMSTPVDSSGPRQSKHFLPPSRGSSDAGAGTPRHCSARPSECGSVCAPVMEYPSLERLDVWDSPRGLSTANGLSARKQYALEVAFKGSAGKPTRLERERKKMSYAPEELRQESAAGIATWKDRITGLRQAEDRRHYRTHIEGFSSPGSPGSPRSLCSPSSPGSPGSPNAAKSDNGGPGDAGDFRSEAESEDTKLHNKMLEGFAGKPVFDDHTIRRKKPVDANINNRNSGRTSLLAEGDGSFPEEPEFAPGSAGASTAIMHKYELDAHLFGHGHRSKEPDKQTAGSGCDMTVSGALWHESNEEIAPHDSKKRFMTVPTSTFSKVVFGRNLQHAGKTMSPFDFNQIHAGAAGMTSHRLAKTKSMQMKNGQFITAKDPCHLGDAHGQPHTDGMVHSSDLGSDISETMSVMSERQSLRSYCASVDLEQEARRSSRASSYVCSISEIGIDP